eukprot:gene8751-11100_t
MVGGKGPVDLKRRKTTGGRKKGTTTTSMMTIGILTGFLMMLSLTASGYSTHDAPQFNRFGKAGGQKGTNTAGVAVGGIRHALAAAASGKYVGVDPKSPVLQALSGLSDRALKDLARPVNAMIRNVVGSAAKLAVMSKGGGGFATSRLGRGGKAGNRRRPTRSPSPLPRELGNPAGVDERPPGLPSPVA